VRLPAVLFQAGAALCVFAIGRKLYSSRVGLAAVAIYALAPGVQLSAMVVATDAPLLMFIGLTLLAYVSVQGAQGAGGRSWPAALGAALGLAFLSKYAAVYAAIGIGLHLAVSPAARRAWSPAAAGLALVTFALVVAPQHRLERRPRIRHDPAHRRRRPLAGRRALQRQGPRRLPGRTVRGVRSDPVRVLIVGAGLAARRRRAPAGRPAAHLLQPPADRRRRVQAFVSRANANWSGGQLPGRRGAGRGLADPLARAPLADRRHRPAGAGRRRAAGPSDGAGLRRPAGRVQQPQARPRLAADG